MARGPGALTVPPGWYPDPDDPDRFRYFDGSAWTGRLAADARGARLPGARPATRSRVVATLALTATVVAALITAWAVIGQTTTPEVDQPPQISPLGPSYDSTGPTYAGDGRPCPTGNPTQRAGHPDDGRVYGGSLSFPRVDGYRPPATDRRLSFARDVQQQAKIVHANAGFETPGWAAELVVGQLRSADGFDLTARLAALQVLDCLRRSTIYGAWSPQTRILEAETWGLGEAEMGRSAFQITAQIVVDNPAAGYPGDLVTIAVLPDAASEQTDWSFFLSMSPIGVTELADQARLTLESLQAA